MEASNPQVIPNIPISGDGALYINTTDTCCSNKIYCQTPRAKKCRILWKVTKNTIRYENTYSVNILGVSQTCTYYVLLWIHTIFSSKQEASEVGNIHSKGNLDNSED